MKALYVTAWLVIVGFFAWSGNLLISIQDLWSEMGELQHWRGQTEDLVAAWRDLGRPGNDVLENYQIETQQVAFATYLQRFNEARAYLGGGAFAWPELKAHVRHFDAVADQAIDLATRVLTLAEHRESLRLADAAEASVRQKEVEAAATMARMDQEFEAGTDLLLAMGDMLVDEERRLEAKQPKNFAKLYLMLLVALVASGLSVQLLHRMMRQRKALHQGRARIEAIVNNVVDGIVTADQNGIVESMNVPAEQMFGYLASEVEGRDFSMLLLPECAEQYRAFLAATRSGAQAAMGRYDCEGVGRRNDGSRFPLELSASTFQIGEQTRVIQIVRDIAERKAAEEGLRQAASVLENISEGVIITDERALIRSVNPAFSVITGYSPEDVAGKNPSLLKSGRHDQVFYERMWSSLDETGHWQGEIWNRRKNGEIYPQWLTISTVRDARGRVMNYVGVTLDITEIKASERVKDEFIATVSHELRTPLTSIRGSLGLIAGGVAGPVSEQAASLIRIAYDNSERLVRLVDEILDIQRMEVGEMQFQLEAMELAPLVASAVDANHSYAQESGTEIAVDSLLYGVEVVADSDRLLQVMTNLLSNAIKFSPPGQKIQVSMARRGRMVQVSVTDRGPGIDEQFRPRVFKRFAQASSSGEWRKGGAGLGLSICKHIVEQLRGRIGFTSLPGVETTFYFDLPMLSSSRRAGPRNGGRAASAVSASSAGALPPTQ